MPVDGGAEWAAANSGESDAMGRLHVFRAGRGPALLLLHGIGSSGTAWSKQTARLGPHFTCLAPDLPGYGESPDASGPHLEDIVDDVAAVLDGQPAHVLGVSFGALTALGLARFRPALVKSLVLADATLGRADLSDAEKARWLQGRRDLADQLAERSIDRAAQIASPDAPPAVVEEIAAHMRRARAPGYVQVARIIAATDARPWLGDIDSPTLILCGANDTVTGSWMSGTLARMIPGAQSRTIPGAGHAPHIEQPDMFAEATLEFLRATDARAH